MQLIDIDKKRYRNHLNKVIAGFIAIFMVLALAFGQTLIFLFADSNSDNFGFNLAGVILALIISLAIISHFKTIDFMKEVFYVWQLKQQINLIYRKLKSVKQQAYTDKNIIALVILSFYYKACRQLYNLDDNTITLSSLTREENLLLEFIQSHHLTINTEHYSKSLLTNF